MKRIFFVTLVFWTGLAAAQMDVRSAKASSHNFSVLGSMASGGFSLGAGYEFMYDTSTGIGAHIRTFSKKTASASSPQTYNGLTIFGASLGHHFFKGKWDLAFTPSFNIISIDTNSTNPGDTTTMGPGMSLSLVWMVSERMGMGFDWSSYWAWFDEDFRHELISDMAFKFKLSF